MVWGAGVGFYWWQGRLPQIAIANAVADTNGLILIKESLWFCVESCAMRIKAIQKTIET